MTSIAHDVILNRSFLDGKDFMLKIEITAKTGRTQAELDFKKWVRYANHLKVELEFWAPRVEVLTVEEQLQWVAG
jgi:hypothetical protein